MQESMDTHALARARRDIAITIRSLFAGHGKIDTAKLNQIFGVTGDFDKDNAIVGNDVSTRYMGEKWPYQGTDYCMMLNIYRALRPKKGEKVYDLGSGQGIAIFCGSLVSEADFIGIELVKERVDVCNRMRDTLRIPNASFRSGNVLAPENDFSDGDIFYLFNPFNSATTKKVVKKLESIARAKREHDKTIRVVCLGGVEIYFKNDQWQCTNQVTGWGTAYIFQIRS